MNKMIASLKKVLPVLTAVALLAGLCAVLVPASPVSAQAPQQAGTPPADETPSQKPGNLALERRFRFQQQVHEVQGRALEKADRLGEKIQRLIDWANEQGLDTSALVAALAEYTQQLAEARQYHAQASQILAAHAGFDENGHVIDATLARQTVKDAADAHRESRQILRQALRDLHKAVKEWREANPRPQPAAQP